VTTGAERGQQLFADLLETMQRTTATMERLDAEQKNQCRIIEQAADKASQTAEDAAEAFASSKPRLMILTALCAAMLVCAGWLVGYWVGHHDGWASGDASGYRQAIASNAAASWANTKSGVMAKRLDEMGNLQPLAACNLPGFSIENGEKGSRWCVVAGKDGQFHGWALP